MALALVGWQRVGFAAGLLLSVGMFPVLMLASGLILTRTESFGAERAIRWGVLAIMAIALASFADLAG